MKMNKFLYLVLFIAFAAIFALPHAAEASVAPVSLTAGLSGAFSGLWDDFTSLVDGYPGIMVAAGFIIAGAIAATKSHPIIFFVFLLIGAIILMAPSLATSTATATFIIPESQGGFLHNVATVFLHYDTLAIHNIQYARNIRNW